MKKDRIRYNHLQKASIQAMGEDLTFCNSKVNGIQVQRKILRTGEISYTFNFCYKRPESSKEKLSNTPSNTIDLILFKCV